ncbi:uncharacterized protein [Lolium perenne]|uniref:uncharacterized protein n=1 Tax=Lolium perenne TaxID=4522 RepID=UPI003A995FA1
MARQRARVASLKDGDANTSFFHRQCSYRKQKNTIHSLSADGRTLTDPAEIAEAAFLHYEGRRARRSRAIARSTSTTSSRATRTSLDLDAPFTRRYGSKTAHARKEGARPDGFTAEFRAHAGLSVKHDVVDMFQQLYELRGRGFSKPNQAFLTPPPKHAGASTLRDFEPISPIHLLAKPFAKVLSPASRAEA